MYPGTQARTAPDKPAVIRADTGQVVTYRQLDDESAKLARALRAAGFGVGDRVAIAMDNDVRYLTACWAARRIGLYYVPMNWHLTAGEMDYVLGDCQAKGLIANGACAEVAARLQQDRSLPFAVAVDADIEGFVDFDDLLADHAAGPLDDETEGEAIVYTSGTTGAPKGAVKPLRGTRPGQSNVLDMLKETWRIDEDTVLLTPGAPLYHAAPLRITTAVTAYGGTNVILGRFDAEAALAAIEQYRVDTSNWVPTMFVRMLRLPEEVRTRYDLSSQRMAVHGAAPCPISVKEQMIEWWGPILSEYYGASEGGGVTWIDSPEWLLHKGSVGRPTIGRFHIVGEDGAELPAGGTGTIYYEGGVPISYRGDEEKTRRSHNDKGWSTVGDVGYIDEEGFLYLTDRQHYMVVSGGVNIYPQEAENVLIQHPKVVDAAVIGVPNEEFGQEVKAVVEVEDPAAADDELAQELMAFCRERLARYKCPRSVDFVEELPRSPAGKLYKRRLMDAYWAGHESRVL